MPAIDTNQGNYNEFVPCNRCGKTSNLNECEHWYSSHDEGGIYLVCNRCSRNKAAERLRIQRQLIKDLKLVFAWAVAFCLSIAVIFAMTGGKP